MDAESATMANDSGGLLILGGQLLGASVVALPAVGAAIRVLTFALGGVHSPTVVGVSAPLAELAAEGFVPMAGVLPLTFLAFGIISWLGPPENVRRRHVLHEIIERQAKGADVNPKVAFAARSELSRIRGRRTAMSHGRTPLLLLVTLQVLLVCLFPRVWAATVGAASGFATGYMTRRITERHGRLSLRNAWAVLVLTLATGVFIGAMSGTLTSVSAQEISFAPEARLDDGAYIALGRTGNTLLLAHCESPDDVISVDQSLVRSSTFIDITPSGQASIFRLVTGDAELSIGWEPVCEP